MPTAKTSLIKKKKKKVIKTDDDVIMQRFGGGSAGRGTGETEADRLPLREPQLR